VKVENRRLSPTLSPAVASDPRLVRLAEWGARLASAGLSPGASGNLSCRTPDGFVISGTEVPLGQIALDDWVEVTGVTPSPAGGLIVESHGALIPSRDAAVHAALYGRRARATTVFHLHVGNLDALRRELLIPATERFFAAGTTESVAEIERFVDGHPDARYFILIDHGIVAWGDDIDQVGALVMSTHEALTGA
jgi:L-fuculose-phosphate aldolase